MILIIDNYDSFTYNLLQRVGELLLGAGQNVDEQTIRVFRNDKITADQAQALLPSHVIVSPGPCSPRESGASNQIIRAVAGRVPLLGVCLGHQCIGDSFGMTVRRHSRLMHGKTSPMYHDGRTIFRGLANPTTATRYHSLIIDPQTFDHERFELSAWTEEGEIMGLRAKPGALGQGLNAPLEGVQFHPESFLSEEGPAMLANFLDLPRPVHHATYERRAG